MQERDFKEFIAAHVVKGQKENVFYSWSIADLPSTLDSAFCNSRYSKVREDIKWETTALWIYGDILHIKIPLFKPKVKIEKYVDVTEDYKKILNRYMKTGIISDRRWWVLFKLLTKVDLYAFNWSFGFVWKPEVKFLDIKESQVEAKVWDESIVFGKNIDKRYKSLMLLVKEVMQWYWDVRTHYLAEKTWKIGKGSFVQQEYKIGEDIHIIINWDKVIDVQQTKTEYSARKDHDGWKIIDWEWKEESVIDFKPYKISKDKDGNTHYHLIWAYTHILRDMMKFTPLTWQFKFLMNFNRINFVAWNRRSGKTFLSAYMVSRELWRMPFSKKHIWRTIKAVYIAPTEDKYKEVIDYIWEMTDRVKVMKIMEYVARDKRLILKDEIVNTRWQKTIRNVAICDFVTGRGFEPARWKASDFVVIDEAAFVWEDVWLNILPIIETEWAAFYGISTIDWNSSRNRFYESLIDYERGYDSEWFWMRVTIDDIDSRLVTDIQKGRMKRALKHNPQRYYAELYATFPDMQSVFNTEWFFRVNSELAPGESVTWIIIGYDPAKRTDVWAVLVGEVRSSGAINLIAEYGLSWEYTTKQKPFIEELKNKYSEKYPTILVMDATQVWDVVAEIFGGLVDYKIWYTAKWTRPNVDDYGVWKVPKSSLVHMTQILMEKDALKADIRLLKLMDEIKNFKSFTTNAGNVKYEAETGHDDYVNAMMLIAFYYGHVEGKIMDIGSDRKDQMKKDWIDPSTGLYNSYSVRQIAEHLPDGGEDGFAFYI